MANEDTRPERRRPSEWMGIATVNSLEQALRKALEKGDATDPAFRRRVYEAAATAMRRSLTERDEATPERLDEQTRRLGEAIRTVETELRGAGAPVDPADIAPPAPPPAQTPARRADDVVPPIDPEPRHQTPEPAPAVGPAPDLGPPEPRIDAPAADDPVPPVSPAAGQPGGDHLYVEARADARRREAEAVRAERAPPVRRSPLRTDRGPFATIFAVVVAVALVFGGLWWVFTSGAFVSQEARDTSVRNPPPQIEGEDFAGRDPGTATAPQLANETREDGEWVQLFDPADPAVLRLEGGATASIESDPFGDYARLITPGGDGRVYIDVPPGVLQRLAGGRVQISLRARSDDGEATQMSVTCEFGPLGDCGRRRFNVDQAETEFLFHVDLPQGSAPREPGFVILQTDIEGGDRAVNLLSARIRPAAAE